MRTSFLVFGSPRIEEDEIQEVVDALRSAWLGTGPKVARFEEMFRDYIGAKYALAVHSCTAALHLSLIASGVKPGDEVITTPMTFAATANAILHTGATPVFADVDRITMNIDPKEIEKKITPATKAILPVHFAGRACDMVSIIDIARRADAILINDAAHAIETEYNGKKIGRYGAMTAYSFYATKNIVTGEGGMVVTDDKDYCAFTRESFQSVAEFLPMFSGDFLPELEGYPQTKYEKKWRAMGREIFYLRYQLARNTTIGDLEYVREQQLEFAMQLLGIDIPRVTPIAHIEASPEK